MSKSYKIIYFGTPNFAADVLGKLSEAGFKPVAVVTQPDKQAGRDQSISPTPVKALAKQLSIPVYSPSKLDQSFIKQLQAHQPDVFIVFAYGKIIPEIVLQIPKHGALNIHPSLLPKYRGPAPIATAILNGESETGVTIIKLDSEMDHGPIVTAQKTSIEKTETSDNLTTRLAHMGAYILIEVLPKYLNGKLVLIAQDDSAATITHMLKKGDGLISWQKTGAQIFNQFRAFQPWPGVFTIWNGKRLKLAKIELLEGQKQPPGMVYALAEGGVAVGTSDGGIKLLELQLEGKQIIEADQFLVGHNNFVGSTLGK